MSIADFDTYKERRDNPWRRERITKAATTVVAGRSFSLWKAAGLPTVGDTPTTAVTCDRTSNGALGQLNSSGTQRILKALFGTMTNASGMVTIVDRLAMSGGLSGTVAGSTVTTNLPTPALPRHTDGVGVMAAVEVYTQIGTTGSVITASYTDTTDAGTDSMAFSIGGTGRREAGCMLLMPVREGYVGVKTITASYLLASTLTAGAFGYTLFYPLISVPIGAVHRLYNDEAGGLLGLGSWFPTIETNACLALIAHMSGASTGLIQAELSIAED